MFFNALPELKDELHQVSLEMERMLLGYWETEEIGSILQNVLAGRGKGYRPGLLLLVGRLGPEYPKCLERLYRLGALVEFVHMASLIHDDIIDDARLRRGRPTIQAKYGKDMAVYTGDMMLAQVLAVLLREDLQRPGLLIAQTIRDMCCGEISQAGCRYRTDMTREKYYANIYGKTASMFVSVCKIGAMESGCAPEVVEDLGQIGLHLGYLFQIRDDLLDFSCENTADGKPTGMDFQEGVFTLPVIRALSDRESRGAVEELANTARERGLTREELKALNGHIVKAGGFTYAAQEAEGHREAIEALLAKLKPCGEIALIRHLISRLTLPKMALPEQSG